MRALYKNKIILNQKHLNFLKQHFNSYLFKNPEILCYEGHIPLATYIVLKGGLIIQRRGRVAAEITTNGAFGSLCTISIEDLDLIKNNSTVANNADKSDNNSSSNSNYSNQRSEVGRNALNQIVSPVRVTVTSGSELLIISMGIFKEIVALPHGRRILEEIFS